MNWQALYDSPWQHPGVALLFNLPLLAWLAWRIPASFFRHLVLLLSAETLLDAFFTGALSPLPKEGPLLEGVSVAFVILGDLRFFVLFELCRHAAAPPLGRTLARALGASLVVPVLQALLLRVFPDFFVEPRWTYWVYEVLLLTWILTLAVFFQKSLRVGFQGVKRWMFYFGALYFCWAFSDLLILFGLDWGLGLRLLPNALYYGGFGWAAWLWGPASLKAAT